MSETEHGTIKEAPAPAEKADRRALVLLGYSLTGGVLWWALHLVATVSMVGGACHFQGVWTWSMNGVTAVTAIGALTAVWASLELRRDRTPVAMVTNRTRFMADVAILFNIISFGLIILEGIPTLVLSPCAR